MYDFHFGSKEDILKNDEDFLIFVKRLLPRWVNGIPDSEYLELYRNLKKIKTKKPVLIETGCGASTLVFFFYASLHGGKLYSWDTNGSKGSFLRSVILEAMCGPLGIDINDTWEFIAFDSTDSSIGIPVLKELKKKADFGFFDSLHTADHLKEEIDLFQSVANKQFMVALDDAYLTKIYKNFGFTNILRAKLGLKSLEEPKDNIGDPFYEVIEAFLRKNNSKVKKQRLKYVETVKNDIFFKYFAKDQKIIDDFKMSNLDDVKDRLKIWSVNK